MRRVVDYQALMFAIAVGLVAGCSNSSGPDLTEGTDITIAEYDIVIPDAAEDANVVTDEKVGVPARLADDPSAAPSEREPVPTEIADGADSDAPDGYQPLAADEANNSSREASQPLNQAAGDDEATKRNGRRSDDDDPKASLIVPKIAEQQDDAPLNDGRGDSAKPIPEGQRVAVAVESVAPDPTKLGRDPDAKPGAELTNPAKAKPTTKPAAPSRKTLADLSESVQALDKDGDGQLGVYEWPREKLAEFKTLDANKDGFLTPAELAAGQKKPSDAEASQTDKESKEEAKVGTPAKADDASQQEDAKTPTAESTDKAQTPDASADEADSKDNSTADDKPTQGS